MSAPALDRLLAALVAALLVTGLLSLRAGSPPTAPLFVLHGLLAGSLLAAVGWKLWRSVPRAAAARHWGALALAMLLALFTMAALIGGFAWVMSGRILAIGPWTVMTLHAWAALCLVPILVAHLLPRRWRVLRLRRSSAPVARGGGRRIERRAALGVIGLAVVGVVAWVAANGIERVAGGMRRFTGSRWLPDGGVPPPTTFFGEGADPLDPATWRLRVLGRVRRPATYSLGTLTALGEVEREAVLDCTSGWALRTGWRGVPLAAVLARAEPDPGARVAIIRSRTGWHASLPLDEARDRALLATAVAGRPLPHDNGAPVRLVAPDRRGLEWVKWVTEVEVA
jgi:DMSO/TMAO reductase YedYZ molybdopterin-dependent catalytic subunit